MADEDEYDEELVGGGAEDGSGIQRKVPMMTRRVMPPRQSTLPNPEAQVGIFYGSNNNLMPPSVSPKQQLSPSPQYTSPYHTDNEGDEGGGLGGSDHHRSPLLGARYKIRRQSTLPCKPNEAMIAEGAGVSGSGGSMHGSGPKIMMSSSPNSRTNLYSKSPDRDGMMMGGEQQQQQQRYPPFVRQSTFPSNTTDHPFMLQIQSQSQSPSSSSLGAPSSQHLPSGPTPTMIAPSLTASLPPQQRQLPTSPNRLVFNKSPDSGTESGPGASESSGTSPHQGPSATQRAVSRFQMARQATLPNPEQHMKLLPTSPPKKQLSPHSIKRSPDFARQNTLPPASQQQQQQPQQASSSSSGGNTGLQQTSAPIPVPTGAGGSSIAGTPDMAPPAMNSLAVVHGPKFMPISPRQKASFLFPTQTAAPTPRPFHSQQHFPTHLNATGISNGGGAADSGAYQGNGGVGGIGASHSSSCSLASSVAKMMKVRSHSNEEYTMTAASGTRSVVGAPVSEGRRLLPEIPTAGGGGGGGGSGSGSGSGGRSPRLKTFAEAKQTIATDDMMMMTGCYAGTDYGTAGQPAVAGYEDFYEDPEFELGYDIEEPSAPVQQQMGEPFNLLPIGGMLQQQQQQQRRGKQQQQQIGDSSIPFIGSASTAVANDSSPESLGAYGGFSASNNRKDRLRSRRKSRDLYDQQQDDQPQITQHQHQQQQPVPALPQQQQPNATSTGAAVVTEPVKRKPETMRSISEEAPAAKPPKAITRRSLSHPEKDTQMNNTKKLDASKIPSPKPLTELHDRQYKPSQIGSATSPRRKNIKSFDCGTVAGGAKQSSNLTANYHHPSDTSTTLGGSSVSGGSGSDTGCSGVAAATNSTRTSGYGGSATMLAPGGGTATTSATVATGTGSGFGFQTFGQRKISAFQQILQRQRLQKRDSKSLDIVASKLMEEKYGGRGQDVDVSKSLDDGIFSESAGHQSDDNSSDEHLNITYKTSDNKASTLGEAEIQNAVEAAAVIFKKVVLQRREENKSRTTTNHADCHGKTTGVTGGEGARPASHGFVDDAATFGGYSSSETEMGRTQTVAAATAAAAAATVGGQVRDYEEYRLVFVSSDSSSKEEEYDSSSTTSSYHHRSSAVRRNVHQQQHQHHRSSLEEECDWDYFEPDMSSAAVMMAAGVNEVNHRRAAPLFYEMMAAATNVTPARTTPDMDEYGGTIGGSPTFGSHCDCCNRRQATSSTAATTQYVPIPVPVPVPVPIAAFQSWLYEQQQNLLLPGTTTMQDGDAAAVRADLIVVQQLWKQFAESGSCSSRSSISSGGGGGGHFDRDRTAGHSTAAAGAGEPSGVKLSTAAGGRAAATTGYRVKCGCRKRGAGTVEPSFTSESPTSGSDNERIVGCVGKSVSSRLHQLQLQQQQQQQSQQPRRSIDRPSATKMISDAPGGGGSSGGLASDTFVDRTHRGMQQAAIVQQQKTSPTSSLWSLCSAMRAPGRGVSDESSVPSPSSTASTAAALEPPSEDCDSSVVATIAVAAPTHTWRCQQQEQYDGLRTTVPVTNAANEISTTVATIATRARSIEAKDNIDAVGVAAAAAAKVGAESGTDVSESRSNVRVAEAKTGAQLAVAAAIDIAMNESRHNDSEDDRVTDDRNVEEGNGERTQTTDNDSVPQECSVTSQSEIVAAMGGEDKNGKNPVADLVQPTGDSDGGGGTASAPLVNRFVVPGEGVRERQQQPTPQQCHINSAPASSTVTLLVGADRSDDDDDDEGAPLQGYLQYELHSQLLAAGDGHCSSSSSVTTDAESSAAGGGTQDEQEEHGGETTASAGRKRCRKVKRGKYSFRPDQSASSSSGGSGSESTTPSSVSSRSASPAEGPPIIGSRAFGGDQSEGSVETSTFDDDDDDDDDDVDGVDDDDDESGNTHKRTNRKPFSAVMVVNPHRRRCKEGEQGGADTDDSETDEENDGGKDSIDNRSMNNDVAATSSHNTYYRGEVADNVSDSELEQVPSAAGREECAVVLKRVTHLNVGDSMVPPCWSPDLDRRNAAKSIEVCAGDSDGGGGFAQQQQQQASGEEQSPVATTPSPPQSMLCGVDGVNRGSPITRSEPVPPVNSNTVTIAVATATAATTAIDPDEHSQDNKSEPSSSAAYCGGDDQHIDNNLTAPCTGQTGNNSPSAVRQSVPTRTQVLGGDTHTTCGSTDEECSGETMAPDSVVPSSTLPSIPLPSSEVAQNSSTSSINSSGSNKYKSLVLITASADGLNEENREQHDQLAAAAATLAADHPSKSDVQKVLSVNVASAPSDATTTTTIRLVEAHGSGAASHESELLVLNSSNSVTVRHTSTVDDEGSPGISMSLPECLPERSLLDHGEEHPHMSSSSKVGHAEGRQNHGDDDDDDDRKSSTEVHERNLPRVTLGTITMADDDDDDRGHQQQQQQQHQPRQYDREIENCGARRVDDVKSAEKDQEEEIEEAEEEEEEEQSEMLKCVLKASQHIDPNMYPADPPLCATGDRDRTDWSEVHRGESHEGRHLETLENDNVTVVTGASTLSAVICLEDGLADDDSWVEEISQDEEEEFATTTTATDSDLDDSSEEMMSYGGGHNDREEELRGYHRTAIDFTLHTIVEESCEDSELESRGSRSDVRRRVRRGDHGRTGGGGGEADDDPDLSSAHRLSASELEKYFFYGLGGDGGSGGAGGGGDNGTLSGGTGAGSFSGYYGTGGGEDHSELSEESSSLCSDGHDSLGSGTASGSTASASAARLSGASGGTDGSHGLHCDDQYGSDSVGDLASSRLEKYFLTGFLGYSNSNERGSGAGVGGGNGSDGSGGSVGSDSEGHASPEQRRKRLVRARGATRSHSSLDNLLVATTTMAADSSLDAGGSATTSATTAAPVAGGGSNSQRSTPPFDQPSVVGSGGDVGDSSSDTDTCDEPGLGPYQDRSEQHSPHNTLGKRKKKFSLVAKKSDNRGTTPIVDQPSSSVLQVLAVVNDGPETDDNRRTPVQMVLVPEDVVVTAAASSGTIVATASSPQPHINSSLHPAPPLAMEDGSRKQNSRDSGFIGSNDDLLKEDQASAAGAASSLPGGPTVPSAGTRRIELKDILGDSTKPSNAPGASIPAIVTTTPPGMPRESKYKSSKSTDGGGMTTKAGGPSMVNLARKDSFNNWSSDEETNLMMSKMRQFFKSLVAASANSSRRQHPNSSSSTPGVSGSNTPQQSGTPVARPRGGAGAAAAAAAAAATAAAAAAAANRTKPPQLVYFENELTRLMKTVPGIRDEQVREIVEYLSSEDTWSDSYDSSDYTSSDLEGTAAAAAVAASMGDHVGRTGSAAHSFALQQEISASCRQIINKFDGSLRMDEEGDIGDGGLVVAGPLGSPGATASDPSLTHCTDQYHTPLSKETAFVYQRLVASLSKAVVNEDPTGVELLAERGATDTKQTAAGTVAAGTAGDGGGGIGTNASSSSPPLIAKVMHHIGSRLVALMHEVSSGESHASVSPKSNIMTGREYGREQHTHRTSHRKTNLALMAASLGVAGSTGGGIGGSGTAGTGAVGAGAPAISATTTEDDDDGDDDDDDSSTSENHDHPVRQHYHPHHHPLHHPHPHHHQHHHQHYREHRRDRARGEHGEEEDGGAAAMLLPRSKSHDLLLGDQRSSQDRRDQLYPSVGSGTSGDMVGEERGEASDYERFSWRGSFESALLANGDSRTKLSMLDNSSSSSRSVLVAKRRSAGDLLFNNQNLSQEQLDRVRSCGSIGGEREDFEQHNHHQPQPQHQHHGGSGGTHHHYHHQHHSSSGYRRRALSSVAADEEDTDSDESATKGVAASNRLVLASRSTLPRSLQNTMTSATTNSLPRLPTSNLQTIMQSVSGNSVSIMAGGGGGGGSTSALASSTHTSATASNGNSSNNGSSSSAASGGMGQKSQSVYHFLQNNVKSARYRAPGFSRTSSSSSTSSAAPKRAMSAPGLQPPYPRRERRNNRVQQLLNEESHSPELVGSGSTTVTAGDEEVAAQGGSPRTGTGSSYERADGSTNGTQKGGGGSMVSSPIGSAGAGSTENWPSQSDEDIDRLVALHQNRASLSSLGVRSDSMASVYSGAGEGRYGTVTVRGQIEFGMQYNYKQGALEIHVKQCKDLAAVDTKRNRSDPYVKVYLLPDKSKSGKRKTKVKKHTLNPFFDEVLRFHMSLSSLQTRTIWATVWHSDMFGRNDFLGEVMMGLQDKVFDNPQPQWYQLQERSEPFEDLSAYKGDIIVGLKYVSADGDGGGSIGGGSSSVNVASGSVGGSGGSGGGFGTLNLRKFSTRSLTSSSSILSAGHGKGALHVLVKEAKHLQPIKSNGTCDAFCKSYLLPDKNRSSKQKTPVIKRTNSPVWNYTFVYEDVSLAELSERALELTIWDHDRLASNEFLGGVRFSLGNGKHNGRAVEWMDSTGKELSLWQNMINRPNFWVEGALVLRPSLENAKFST
ncbi:uncharacterized protein LOC125956529 isoform X2 [Anopheles darlingi]|uniref:uncharacterized protein LOC125956529 isoform X2 n=1 Tax=Anopheles darlingi TaxID=43151 RepID=UPI0021001335|nr:uncharacterized protein LOC125956529 isoform X2 [Anopheles darlingi]